MTLSASSLHLPTRLDAVSVELNPSQITAICGPNGAGKSTLMSCLAGLLAPDRGTVALEGETLGTIAPQSRAQRIGYLPQEGEVAWDVSVRNLVALGRLPHRDRGERQVEAALEAVHLTSFANRPISTLSGGEKARALLARVLCGEPDWVLADEPLAALDFYHQHEVLSCLHASANQGTGVVLVLHDLALAMNHADRVVVLKEGRLIADGPPEIALSTDTIIETWGVAARWVGEPGAQALVTA